MQFIGITGSSGSGKSTVANYYASLGYTVIDGDGISRQLAVPGSEYGKALAEAFGPDICDETGALCRRRLGRIAFESEEGRQKLTRVTTPLILAEVQRQKKACADRGEKLAFLDGAIILGTPFQSLCDQVIVVLADRKTQLARIAQRDQISLEEASQRLDRQWTNEQMAQAADLCLQNRSEREALLCKAKEILDMMKSGL